MEHDHVLVDGEYIKEAAKQVAENAISEFMQIFLQETKKAVAGTTTKK